MSQNDQHEQQNDNQQIPNVKLNVNTEIVKAKPAQKVYKCKKCGKEFTSRSAFNAHVWEHTKAEREKAKVEKEKKVETEVVKMKEKTEEIKPTWKYRVISIWEKTKWYILGSVFVVIFFVLYWYWKKKKEKEGNEQ